MVKRQQQSRELAQLVESPSVNPLEIQLFGTQPQPPIYAKPNKEKVTT